MRVTRLHLVLGTLGIGCLLFGFLSWMRRGLDNKGADLLRRSRVPAEGPRQKVAAPPAQKQAQVARTLAIVGEAYRPLRKRFGDIPPVSKPLRAAKQFLAEGQNDQALASARESWQALKTFRTRVDQTEQTYQVVRGDTLWRIAQMHSPVHAGPGWVTIWKANQAQVQNFNRLEVGWTLKIPLQRADYFMPFWKPKPAH